MEVQKNRMPVEIRITDSFTIRKVIEEQNLQGESTMSKTAGRLIIERLRELEIDRRTDRSKSEITHSPVPAA